MSVKLMLFLCFALFSCWWFWRKWRYIVTYWKVGSRYPALPFLGHVYLIGSKETILQWIFRAGEHAIKNGGLSSIWFLDEYYLLLADAKDAEYILKNHLEKCDLAYTLRLIFRSSFLFTPVNQWRPRRKIISTLFSPKNVSKFEPVFARSSKTLMRGLQPISGKEAFSIWNHFSDYTVETTCHTVLGIKLKSQNSKQYLRKALNAIMDAAGYFQMWSCLHLVWLMKRTKFYETFVQNDNVIKSYIDEALEKHEKDTQTISESDALGEEEHTSLVHMFMQMKKQKSLDHSLLHDETLGLMVASSDTTGITMSIIAVELARKPEVQEKIFLELKEVFGDSDRSVTLEDLPRLKYLEAVIKEMMRLYPAVPHISRKTLVDTTLPSGLAVPKGTNFLVSIYALNRNPKHWGPDADQFRPERFLDGLPEQTTFFAFSHGPKGCLGTYYAFMSMKTVLATLLRQYRLLPAGDAPLRLRLGMTVQAVDDFQVRIEARK